MPVFGKTSKDRLKTCHPQLQEVLLEAIKHYDFTILCGHRNEEEQNAAYFATPQKSTLMWPHSKHNTFPSLAVDVAPYYKEKPHIRWNRLYEFVYLHGIIRGLASERGIIIRSGIDWDRDDELITDQKFDDFPHIEIIL